MIGSWRDTPGRGPFALDLPNPRKCSRAAFVDRDGVINEGMPDPETERLESPLRVEDVRLLPGVSQALRLLADAGYALVCVTNQPAAAKGKISLAALRAIHERVLELLAREDVMLDATRLCPHHPHGVVSELSGPCTCRKPAPGMLLDAARALRLDRERSWMLGDTDADMLAGTSAGCRAGLIEYPGSAHKRSKDATPSLRANDLPDAVAQLLTEDRY